MTSGPEGIVCHSALEKGCMDSFDHNLTTTTSFHGTSNSLVSDSENKKRDPQQFKARIFLLVDLRGKKIQI